MLLRGMPPLLNQLADQAPKRSKLKCKLQVAIRLLGDHLEGIDAHFLRQPVQIGAEDGLEHDFKRQFAGVARDIDGFAPRRHRRPALGVFLVHLVDQKAELIDDAAVKGGLHHASLPAPEAALAGHDAVTEQDLDSIHALALGVVAVIGQKHALDVIGVIDDVVEYSAAGREYAVNIAEPAKIILQPGKRLLAA